MSHFNLKPAAGRWALLVWLLIAVGAVQANPSASPSSTSIVLNEEFGSSALDLTMFFSDSNAAHTLTYAHVSSASVVSVSVNSATGAVTFTSLPDRFGSETLTFEATDNIGLKAQLTVNLTVDPVNDPPSFTAGADETVAEDAGAQTVSGWATAISPGASEGAQSVAFTATPTDPTLFSAQPSIDPSGNLTYTPAPDANGSTTIQVTLQDDGGTPNGGMDTSPSHSLTINITAVDDPPAFTAGGDQVVLEDSGATTITGFASGITAGAPDEDVSQTLTFNASNDNNALFSVQPSVSPGGDLTFTVVPDMFGAANVDLTLSDGASTTAPQTFAITITNVNDAPSFTGGANEIVAEDAGGQTINAWATAISPGPNEGAQNTTFTATASNPALFSAQPAIDSSGNLTYTPAPDANGSTTVQVTLQDDGGTANGGTDISAPQSFTIDITAVNDTPVFTAGTDLTVPEDSGAHTFASFATGISAGAPDEDATQTLTFIVSNDNNALFTTQPALNSNGDLTFTVAANAAGAANVTVSLSDGSATSPSQGFAITVANVNDAPSFTAGADQAHLEDAGSITIPGWASGISPGPVDELSQILTFNVVSNSNPALFSTAPSITAAGDLSYALAGDANGSATIAIALSDSGGTAGGGADTSAPQSFTVDVTPVNDAPTLTLGPDITVAEDAGAQTINGWATGVAGPAEEPTTQSLTYTVVANSNPALFSVAPTVDAAGTLTFTSATDANGSASISVSLSDDGGVANGGADAATTQSFSITVQPVSDAPIANPDSATVVEDAGPVVIPVLANDYLAEQPTVITQAGVGGFSESTPTNVLDPLGNVASDPNGEVVIINGGTEIQYLPKPNFSGTDTFSYTITDVEGDSHTGTVTVNVTAVNDPPEGIQERSFSLVEGGTLIVNAATGLKVGSYDVDHALVDASGNLLNPPALSITPTTATPLGLTLDTLQGTFTYTPSPVTFTGEVTFEYRLDDGTDLSTGAAYRVRITVVPAPPPPAPPPAGQVAITYNLANVPLEQSTSVPPNVLVVMDDSGSMDWNMIVAGPDEDGGFVLDNSSVANSGKYAVSYVYLWDLPSNAYPPSSSIGRILPTEAALQADVDTNNNSYGVWRGRTHLHNKLYYNPGITYTPWTGQDNTNQEFTNANKNAIRLDPVDPTNLFDMLAGHSYTATRVPEWDWNGGRTHVSVSNVYIPHYYTTTATPPLAWDDSHTLVQICQPGSTLPDGSACTGGPLAGGMYPGPNREDCGGDDICTYAEEIQNFANWFQYYRSREYVTKNGIGKVVSQLQDIRVGYETISAGTSEPVRLMNSLHTQGNKKLLMDNIYQVDSFGGTPLRQALGRAGDIFACQTGTYCPALPAPEGLCQQNFALLFSDGYWNGGTGITGNPDSDGAGPFDGGRYKDTISATLADVAMHFYETDIQPGLADQVPLMRRDVDGVPPNTFTGPDPKMHQHMKTYTISFGVAGTVDPSTVPLDPTQAFTWKDPFSNPQHKIDDMLHAAVNGRGRFLNASDPQTLQAAFESAFLEFTQAASSTSSAAFNSTSLRNGTLLYRGFYDLRDNTGELTATFVNADGSLQPSPTWQATQQLDNITPGGRTIVTFDPVNRNGIPFRHASLTQQQQAVLDANQVDYLRGVRTAETTYTNGTLRERPATQGLLGDIVNSSPIFVGPPQSFNRDQRPYPTGNLYSSFVSAVKNRTPVVYVGANDGMMHGFNALTGDEVFAYVPNKIIDSFQSYSNKLDEFTSPFYQHNYYVDLTPRLNDVYMRSATSATKAWRTVLVGGLGAGGKGFYALDVTDPDIGFSSEANAATKVLWEFTDEDDAYPVDASGSPLGGSVGAYTDPLGKPVKDLGYSLSLPSVVMSNVNDGASEKEWVAIFGNGPNSTAGYAKLFVLSMDGGVNGWGPGDVIKLDTGFGVPASPHPLAGYPNGLGSPAVVDEDLNGTADLVYAGDRLGNLFRFDLRDSNPSNWTVTRLFTASYDTGGGNLTVQPILSEPLVTKHPTQQGFLVIFGTGSYVTRNDADSEDIQSIYAIWDRGANSPVTAQANTKQARLVQQTITNVVDDSTSPALTRRIVSTNPVNYQPDNGGTPGTYGWYIDLNMQRAASTLSGAANPDTSGRTPPSPQFPGEKAIRRLLYRDGTIITTTVLPSLDEFSCFGPRPGSILVIDGATGGDAGRPVVDFNNDGVVDDTDLVTVNGQTFSGGLLFNQLDLDGALVDLSTLGGSGDTDFLFVSGGNQTVPFRIDNINDSRTGRLSWRELD